MASDLKSTGRSTLDAILPATTESPEQTERLGALMAAALGPGDIVALVGDLGAGKTHLARGIAFGLGADGSGVSSPTFTIAHEYAGDLDVYHLDLYRLKDENEVKAAGLEDYLFGEGVCLVEWPERAGSLLPDSTIVVRLLHRGETRRGIERVRIGTEAR